MAFYRVKKNKRWIHKAVSRETGKTVAWVIGGRDADTFRRLFDKVKHLNDASITLTIGKRLPRYFLRSVITSGNQGQRQSNVITAIHAIILDDSHARTKIVSKKLEMVDNAMKLWTALTDPEVFRRYQKIALSIFV